MWNHKKAITKNGSTCNMHIDAICHEFTSTAFGNRHSRLRPFLQYAHSLRRIFLLVKRRRDRTPSRVSRPVGIGHRLEKRAHVMKYAPAIGSLHSPPSPYAPLEHHLLRALCPRGRHVIIVSLCVAFAQFCFFGIFTIHTMFQLLP